MNDSKISKSSLVCPNCGSADIDTEPARGDSVCVNCGSVVEDILIVSEIGFQEGTHGGVSVLGTFVSDDGMAVGTSSKKLGGTFSSIPSSNSSAHATLNNARSGLNRLASQLRLNSHCVDTAVNFYKLALAQNLTRGRRQPILLGALMYLVCRLEGTSHLLLDFSDALQASIYDLGKTYLKLSAELCINAPITDPALYIPRFAQKLELGKKTHEVSMTALRLVSRMKKDWIHAGRRPSGLCGAALLVASRLHNFNRTTQQVVKIVRIRETTLKKRLKEFAATPSAALSLTEFFEIDLEEECDPPSYIKSKMTSKSINRPLDNIKIAEVTNEIRSVQLQIEEELDSIRGGRKRTSREASGQAKRTEGLNKKSRPQQHHTTSNPETPSLPDSLKSALFAPSPLTFSPDETSAAFDLINREIIDDILSEEHIVATGDNVTQNVTVPDRAPSRDDAKVQKVQRYVPDLKGLGIDFISTDVADQAIERGGIRQSTCQATDLESAKGHLDLSGIDDEEIDAMLMQPAEIEAKTLLWENEFGTYVLEREAARSLREEAQRLKSASRPASNRKHKKTATTSGAAKTPLEAIQRVLKEKRISSKINYDVLKDLTQQPAAKHPAPPPLRDKLTGRPSEVAAAYESMATEAALALGQEIKPLSSLMAEPDHSGPAKVAAPDVPGQVIGAKLPPHPQMGTTDEEEGEEEDEGEGDDDNLLSAAQLLASMRGSDFHTSIEHEDLALDDY